MVLNLILVKRKFSFPGVREINIKFSNNAIYLMGMCYTRQSSTFGLGVNYQKKVLIQGYYTNQLAA